MAAVHIEFASFKPKLRQTLLRIVSILLLILASVDGLVISQILIQPSAKPARARLLQMLASTNKHMRRDYRQEMQLRNHEETITVYLSIALLTSAIGLGTAVVMGLLFLSWFVRMHSNLRALGATARHPTPFWIAALFLPVVNLFSVLFMMLELWSQSDPGRLEGSSDERSPATLVVLWWVFGAVAAIGVLALVGNVLFASHVMATVQICLALAMVVCIAVAFQQVVQLVLLRSVTTMQEKRYALVNLA